MDLDELTPEGGGALGGPVAPLVRQYATAFTQTPAAYVHPDTIWSPRGGELAPPQRPLTRSPDFYAGAESERPARKAYMGEEPIVGNVVANTARTVRVALRPA